jgi:HD-like signal output (HDOD) protein
MVGSAGTLVGSLEDIVARGDFVVPPYPAAAMRLRRIVDTANFGLSEVADAASTDPALAAALLRVANSSLYRGTGAAITTVGRAVHRLGARAVASIAIAAGLSAGACADGVLVDVKYRVWRCSVSCALACQQLAAARSLDPEEAFLAGLLYGFGRSVAVGCLERVLPNPPVAERTLLEWLQTVEPHRHALARRVAEQWQLPAEIIQAVATNSSSGTPNPIASLVALGDRLASAIDRGASAEQLATTQGVAANERRVVTGFALGLPQALQALVEPAEPVKRKSGNAVSKPPSALSGEQHVATVPVVDLKNRKEPIQLETLTVAQEGIAFLSQRPMQESSVARLALGTPPKAVEGWFSVALCVPDHGRYRIEAQAFAASRELKDLLLELWTAAKRR